MHKWTVFPFIGGLLLFSSNIFQSTFSYQFYLKWKSNQLALLVCLYEITYSYFLYYPPSPLYLTFILLPLSFLIRINLPFWGILIISLLLCTKTIFKVKPFRWSCPMSSVSMINSPFYISIKKKIWFDKDS